MPLQTMDSGTSSPFRRGLSPLARLGLAAAVALFLMVADTRFLIGQQIRATLATVLRPVQWMSAQPIHVVNLLGGYVTTVEEARSSKEQAAILIAQHSLKAQQADLLERENEQLRQLLGLQQRLPLQARAAEVVHIASDLFARKVVVNKGSVHGVAAGAAVIDGYGLLGQVTRVFPLSSEVTLIDNAEQATPVLNGRTGERSLVYGDSQAAAQGGSLEVRYLSGDINFQVGDVLLTSGMGGNYPAGLPVGTVAHVDTRNNSAFVRVQVAPAAHSVAPGYVLVLDVPPAVATETNTDDDAATSTRYIPRAARRERR